MGSVQGEDLLVAIPQLSSPLPEPRTLPLLETGKVYRSCIRLESSADATGAVARLLLVPEIATYDNAMPLFWVHKQSCSGLPIHEGCDSRSQLVLDLRCGRLRIGEISCTIHLRGISRWAVFILKHPNTEIALEQ